MTREPDEGCGDADPTDGSGAAGTAGTAGAAGSTPHDEFEQIVAYWRAEGSVPAWPDAPDDSAPAPEHRPAAREHRPVPRDQAPAEAEDDHYHPPEPPPLPRPGPPAIVGAGLIILGLVLVAVPETLGLSSLYGLPLGLLGIAAGLTWLVMRMWPSAEAEDPHDGDDDGAIL